jgi:tetratricopeptide (TPR) repeat protein
MYDYNRRRKIGPGSILLFFLFSASVVGLAILLYLDKGKFWDVLPFFCIPIVIISLIMAVYNLVRRCNAGFIFILFFAVFTIGVVLSSIFGPFALKREADRSLESENYSSVINSYKAILDNYPSSRYAPEALKGVSFAYYYNRQYSRADSSFQKSIEEGIIDPDKLQIMDIMADINFQMAELHNQNGDYLKAAEYYVESVELLKKIKSTFPDTDEAFIAEYRIPDYLFLASENYNRGQDRISSIEVLREIVDDYPESDYYDEAYQSLLDTYIEYSVELASSYEHEEAVSWFLQYLEKDPGLESLILKDYKINKIFGEAPPSVIKKFADKYYLEGDYLISIFLYEVLIEYNPEYTNESSSRLIDSKIQLAYKHPYNEISGSILKKYSNTPETSIMIFQNNTKNILSAYIQGPRDHILTIPPEDKVELEIEPGDYVILIEPDDSDMISYMGSVLFEEYSRYTWILETTEE